MCALLFKFVYSKMKISIEENINEIRLSIERLERRREEAIIELNEKHRAFEEAKKSSEKEIQDAEARAKQITDQAAEMINNALSCKQIENDKEIEKIKIRLYAELHHKISEMVMKEIKKKVEEMRNDRDFQNSGIDSAINRLESLMNRIHN
jgi:F0F1-type ATP synthase membrane subunit b/b'